MSDKAKNIIRVVFDVLVVLLLVTAVLISVIVLSSKATGFGNFFGYTVSSVQSDSMQPTFAKGDVIIGKTVSQNDTFNVDDIITFEAVIDGQRTFNTHRIKEIVEISGVTCYYTKGDNTPTIDEDYVVAEQIYSKYQDIHISRLGYAFDFLKSSTGFFFCLLLPMIILFIIEIIEFINNLVKYNREKVLLAKETAVEEITEEQKRKIAEEYLASQNAETDNSDENKSDKTE